MSNSVPRFPFRLLEMFCPTEIREGIEGDLIQQYDADVKQVGENRAARKLLWNTLRFFRPGIFLRNQIKMPLMSSIMLRSYFTISFRYLLKNRTFTVINIAGLALGMAAALLIYEYVSFERSYDKFHSEAENIYRVTTQWNKDLTANDIRATTMPWSGLSVKEAFQEVKEFARLTKLDVFTGLNAVRYNDILVNEQRIFLADPAFLQIFNFEMIKGDPATALIEPTSIILTQSSARKFFKDEDPIGKIVFLDSHNNLPESNFKVSGVVKDPPSNSHIDFDFLISFNVIYKDLHNGSTYWHWDYTYCYLKLEPAADPKMLAEKMGRLRVSQFGKDMQYYKDVVDFHLQPIKDIHLSPALKGELSTNNDSRAISFLIIIGCCILLCAYINYINLATVKAIERKTEIGIRKVMGSSRRQLSLQLLVESFVLNLSAFLLGVLIYIVSVPLLENLFNLQWPALESIFLSGRFLMVLSLVLFAGVVISVIYPAFILTRFQPAHVLKGSGMKLPATGLSLRKALLVIQFIFCIGFTVGAYTLHRQLIHMKTFDLGMNVNQVLVVKGYGFQKYKAYEDFKSELLSSKNINSIGISSVSPGDEVINLGLKPLVSIAGKSFSPVELKLVTIDNNFFNTIGVKLAAGRNFEKGSVDQHVVIINEAAAKLFGYNNSVDIVGEKLTGLEAGNVDIIGVIKNYNQRSLKNDYEPMVYFPMWNNDYGWNNRYYFIRLEATNVQGYQSVIGEVEQAWRKVNPEKPFQYFFLDNYFDDQYRSDATNTSLFMFFAGFAIFIACLGLFGLVAYTTLQRTKEIGVRKVLGATVQNILILLSKDFVVLLIVASLIAIPPMTLAGNYWLQQYAFRINVGVMIFAVPLFFIFVLAISTVIIKSFSVANANPVDSLRYE